MSVVLTSAVVMDDVTRAIRDGVVRSGQRIVEVAPEDMERVLDHGCVDLVVVLGGDAADEAPQLCRRVRMYGDSALLLVCRCSREVDELMAFRAGCDDFVHLPASELVIEARIGSLLARSRGGRAQALRSAASRSTRSPAARQCVMSRCA